MESRIVNYIDKIGEFSWELRNQIIIFSILVRKEKYVESHMSAFIGRLAYYWCYFPLVSFSHAPSAGLSSLFDRNQLKTILIWIFVTWYFMKFNDSTWIHLISILSRWQWCWWHRDVGKNMDIGDWLSMLATSFECWILTIM